MRRQPSGPTEPATPGESSPSGPPDEREEYYRALFELSTSGVLLARIDGTVLDANAAACEMLGMTVDEIRARGRVGLVAPSPEVDSGLEELAEQGRTLAEVTFVRKDGTTFPAELSSVVLPDESPVARTFISFRDITQRKSREAALRQSEERYERLLDVAHDCVWEMDENARYTFFSPKIEEIIGFKPEELLGKTPFELMAPDESERLATFFVPIAEARRAFVDLESINVHKDGRLVLGETTGVPIFEEDGTFRGYWGVSRDITERRRAEEERQRSHDLLEKLSAHIPGAIFQYRLYPDGRACLPWASDGIRDVFEVTPEEVRESAAPLLARLHPDDREYVIGHIDESARTLEPFHMEYRVVLPKRGLRWHLSDSTPERAADGGTLWHGITLDITERRQMEEALRQSEDRYRQLVEAAHDWVWEVDENVRYIFASPKVTEILGYTPEEVLGKTPFDLMTPDEAGRVEALIGPHIAARQPFFDLAKTNLHKDGHPVVVETTGVPVLGDEGDLRGYRGMDHDVTERRLAEEALQQSEARLRQSQKMEAVGRLAGGIAHDFNNLLTAIIGYSDLMMSDLEFEKTAWFDDVREIKAAAERAGGLTHQILAFSRRQRLQSEVVSVNRLVMEIAPLLRRTLGEDVELVTRLAPNLSMVEIDPQQFTQALMNLAVNARDAMPSGGTLTFGTGNVWLDEDSPVKDPEIAPGAYVRVTVSDTGVGIDPTAIPLIYEPFYTTKPPGQGTGLGLPTVYGVVKQSGGAITVDSTPGKGTTFEIFLPRAKEKQGARPGGDDALDKGAPSPAPAQQRVLVVEDEESVRRLTERILTQLGYAVLSAANGPEALDILQSKDTRIDLLLTDVVLPGGLDGGEIARRARLLREDLAVLYVSGYTRNVLLDSGNAEDVHYLEKPFTAEQLATKVEESLTAGKGLPGSQPTS